MRGGEGRDGDADDEAVAGEPVSGEGERMSSTPEDDVVRKLLDPKLPSQEEVDRHYAMGHAVLRNWCPVYVRANGKEMDHKRGGDGDRRLPEYRWAY